MLSGDLLEGEERCSALFKGQTGLFKLSVVSQAVATTRPAVRQHAEFVSHSASDAGYMTDMHRVRVQEPNCTG